VKRYKVIIQAEAEKDLQQALAYIQAESPGNAAPWLEGLIEAIRSLEMMPARCAYAPEREDCGADIRQYLYHSHRILFTIEGSVVCVHHIRHAAMRTLKWISGISTRERPEKQ